MENILYNMNTPINEVGMENTQIQRLVYDNSEGSSQTSGLICTVPGCKIKYSLCVDHKSSNSSLLDYITKLYEKPGLNVSFMHTIETLNNEETGQPSILIANKPNMERPNYCNIKDLLDSVDTGIQPMVEGFPHFILFRMQGLQNQPLTIAYDTCAAVSIFRRDVLGTSIAAVEIETSSKHFVKGIGGRQKSALFCALIPLEEGNKHQLISCHSVEEITEIRTHDISQIIDFVTHNQKETSLTREQRPINESMISEIRSCFNFADLGETIQIDGLIGINDFLIAPKLILETKIGINFYSVPIKPFGGGSKICLGGSVPNDIEKQQGLCEAVEMIKPNDAESWSPDQDTDDEDGLQELMEQYPYQYHEFVGMSGDPDGIGKQQELCEAVEMIKQNYAESWSPDQDKDDEEGLQELMEQYPYQYHVQNITTRPINDTPPCQDLPRQHMPELHPPPRPIYSCIICSTKSRIDQTPFILSLHPINPISCKLLREACPVLMELQNIKERHDLLVRLNICLACLTCSLEDPRHGPNTCIFPYTNIICNEPYCSIRKTVCNAHKNINHNVLVLTTRRYQQLGLSLIII